jgi:signal transduction histidine kinase
MAAFAPRRRALLRLAGFAVLATAPAVASSAAGVVVVDPAQLPLPLGAGWEAAPPGPGVAAPASDDPSWAPTDPLKDPGPYDTARWYRLRLDLSSCRGLPLAFYAPSIRDADDAYLDGVRIGGLGTPAPRRDPANLMARLYPLPTDLVNAPGVRTLTLRVYHGPRESTIFRETPSIDRLVTTAHVGRLEQAFAALAGIGFTLVAAFVLLFFAHGRREPVLLNFAAFSAMLVLYLLSGHTVWARLPVPRDTPFRVAGVAAVLLWLSYYGAARRLLEWSPPRRFRLYTAGFLAFAVATAVVPDIHVLVTPTRIAHALLFVCLLEMTPLILGAIRGRKPGAWGVLVGLVFFGGGVGVVDQKPFHTSWSYVFCGIVLMLFAVSLSALWVKQMGTRAAVVLQERSRMARAIHDTLAQGFAGICVQLESVAETLRSAPAEAEAHLHRAQDLARSSLAEARRSVWDLRTGPLDAADFPAALRRAIDQLTAQTQLRAEVRVRGRPRPLPGLVASNLLHIGQEAVANALKHAGAERVRVELAYETREVMLRVEDDGCGFEAAAVSMDSNGHFGLLGMRERAQQMGGCMRLESDPGSGTRVAVAVPTG